MISKVRVEKVANGYVVRTGGSGFSEKEKQLVAKSLDEVMVILDKLFTGKETP